MATWKRLGLIFSVLAAALLVLPAAADARHGHRGHWHGHHHHHHHHHGHWHHGHWHHGHHYHRHWYGYRSWYPRSYVNFRWSVGYLPYYSYWSYYWPTTWYAYTPRSFFFNVGIPYYRLAVPYYGVAAPYYGCSTESAEAAMSVASRPALRTPVAVSDTDLIAARVAARLEAEGARVERVSATPVVERVSRQQSATRVLSSGDSAFHGGRYDNAAGFYKIAAERSPEDATAHVRAGHALLAARRYHDAYRSFCRALEIDAGALEQAKLDELYVDPAEKEKQLERLAKTTLDNANNPVLHALLGIYLMHDGQAPRAEKFFAEAQRLSGGTERISGRLSGATVRHVASAR